MDILRWIDIGVMVSGMAGVYSLWWAQFKESKTKDSVAKAIYKIFLTLVGWTFTLITAILILVKIGVFTQ